MQDWKSSLDNYLTFVPEYEQDFEEEQDELFSNCCGVAVYDSDEYRVVRCPKCLEMALAVPGEDFDD